MRDASTYLYRSIPSAALLLLPTLPKRSGADPDSPERSPICTARGNMPSSAHVEVSCPSVPFHPFSCSATAQRRSTATVCVFLLTLPVPDALQTVAVDVGLCQYRKSSIPSRTLPRKRARPKVSSKVKGNCRPQRWRPGLQFTFGQYRSLFRSWIQTDPLPPAQGLRNVRRAAAATG